LFKQRQTTGTNISCLCDSDYKTTVKFEYDKCKPRVHNQIGGTNLPIITFSFPTILNIFLFIFIDYLRYLYRFEDTRSTKRLEDSTMLSAPHVSSHYLEKELKKPCGLFIRNIFSDKWKCYHYSATDKKQIKKKGQKAVCQRFGRIFTRGKNYKYPGCKTCWCCQKKGTYNSMLIDQIIKECICSN